MIMSFNVSYNNEKERDDLLRVLNKAGFTWHNNTKTIEFKPPIDEGTICIDFGMKKIKFASDCIETHCTAKELLMLTDSHEMTAKEFIHKYKRMNNCEDVPEKECVKCIWSRKHTKCGADLCDYFDFQIETDDEFEKELLEIIETHDSPVWIDPEKEAMKKETEEAVGILEGTIKGLKDSGINNKLTEALKVALDSLKGE
jgi:hypothetical protein